MLDASVASRVLALAVLGGKGSGFHGHAGRPGKVGGSAPSGFENAPQSKAGAAKWRRQQQNLYDDDLKFRAAADAITLLTQGSTHFIRAASVAAAEGDKALMRGFYREVLDEPLSRAANPISKYRNYFEGQDVENADYATLREAGEALNSAIDGADPLDVPIFRGMPVTPYLAIEKGQRLDPISGHVVIVDEKAYQAERKRQQESFDYKQPAQNPFLAEIDRLKKGDAFNMPGVTSFTTDKYTADQFARGEARGQGGRGDRYERRFSAVTLEVQGARGIPVAALSPWDQKEVLTRGKFVVDSVTKTPYRNIFDYYLILRPR